MLFMLVYEILQGNMYHFLIMLDSLINGIIQVSERLRGAPRHKLPKTVVSLKMKEIACNLLLQTTYSFRLEIHILAG